MAGGGWFSRGSRKAKVAAAVLSGVGAVLIGVWQGLGTGIAERILPTSEAKAPTATPPPSPTGLTPVPPSPRPPLVATSEIVRKRVLLSVSAVGVSASEAGACDAAVRDLVRQAESQCDRALMEQGGSSRRLEGATNECRTCGVAGGDWRCVAQSTPECVIMGGNNDRSTQ